MPGTQWEFGGWIDGYPFWSVTDSAELSWRMVAIKMWLALIRSDWKVWIYYGNSPTVWGELWRLFRPFTRHCQHTFNYRVVCCYLISTQFGDAFVPIWCIVMPSNVCELSWSAEELIVFCKIVQDISFELIFSAESFMLSYLSYLCVQNKKFTEGGGGQKNLWPSLQNMNLPSITLENPSNSYSLNHGLCPVLFILFKPHSLLGLLDFYSLSINPFILTIVWSHSCWL